MANSNLKSLLSEYEKKRFNHIYEAEQRKDSLYKKYPRLQEIDDILSKEAIRVSKLLIVSKDDSLLDDLNKNISALKKEKEDILKNIGKDINYFKPCFDCNDCQDTGYITKNSTTEMCHCLKQKLFDLEYNKTNLYNLEKQNFNNFSLDLYSTESNEAKYNSNISPRENIEKIKKISIRFIDNFDNENEKNLLFTGNTGLRKIIFVWMYR